MRGEEELISVVMRLRAAAPQAWDDFIDAMKGLYGVKAAELVRAPTESVHQMQGQARAFEDIVEMLTDAPKKAAKAEEIRRGRSATRPQSGAP
jgi:hypothetical protein